MSRTKGAKNKVKVPTTTLPALVSSYKVTLTLGNETFVGSGETPLLALKAVPIPVKIFTKGLITMSSEGKMVSRMLMPFRLKRFFMPLSQAVQAKQFALLMK